MPRAKETPRLDTMPDVLTVEQAAKVLQLSVYSVYEMVHRKEIPAFHRGRTIRISRVRLQRWLEGGEPTTPVAVAANE